MSEEIVRKSEKFVLMVDPAFFREYTAMCEALGEGNRSEHIRAGLEGELALYKASMAK